MSELIRREDALEAIKNSEFGKEYDEVEKVPAVAAPRWVRVEDELPPVGKVVWCYFSGSKLYEALAFHLVAANGDLVWQDATHCFNFRNGVTHWRHIEPPEEESTI